MGRQGVSILVPASYTERAPTGEPLSRLWDEFERTGQLNKAESTRKNYARTRELSRHLGDYPTPRAVVAWLSALQTAGMKPGTVRLHRDLLMRVYNFSNATGAAHGNPVALAPFRPPKPQRQAIRGIHEVWPFLEAVAVDERERGFWAVMRYAALRPGEARALEARDVLMHSDGWWLSVTKQRHPGKLAGSTYPKTRLAHRRVPVADELRPYLARVLKLGAARVRTGNGGGVVQEVPFLFPYRVGDERDQVARLRGVCPDGFPEGDAMHVFRHSCAVELVTRYEARTEQVQKFLGHASLKETDAYLRGLIGAIGVGHELFAKGGGPEPPRKKRPGSALARKSRPPR